MMKIRPIPDDVHQIEKWRNRLSVKPPSKLAGYEWVAEQAFIEGLASVSDDECYRAMDFLHAALAELQERVFFNVANLLDPEIDLLFFDTTSTYWETDRLADELLGSRRSTRSCRRAAAHLPSVRA